MKVPGICSLHLPGMAFASLACCSDIKVRSPMPAILATPVATLPIAFFISNATFRIIHGSFYAENIWVEVAGRRPERQSSRALEIRL
jgi:hypothetical protein